MLKNKSSFGTISAFGIISEPANRYFKKDFLKILEYSEKKTRVGVYF